MSITRRDTLIFGLSVVASTRTASRNVAAPRSGVSQNVLKGCRRADPGDGRYLNPVLSGDHPDPTVLKDGPNYYATFSSFDATPGLVIWHSWDLVNWTQVTAALEEPLGVVFAPDLAKHEGRYYLYIPFIPASWSQRLPPQASIFVIHANSIRGPWSDPIDLGIRGYIDPGHVVGEDAHRYLFLNDGHRVRLTNDGLGIDGPIEKVYDGWRYPEDWITEAYALEGHKLFRRGDWFYLVSAVGGTSGPPTGHMVIVARSLSIHGPWENNPRNPIVRTRSSEEHWWSRGHATVVEGPDGNHWMLYHGYENGYRSLGRQLLLEPVQWHEDAWFTARGGDLSAPLRMPKSSAEQETLSYPDAFESGTFGLRWTFFAAAPTEKRRATFDGASLILQGKGSNPSDCCPLVGFSRDHSYECSVDAEVTEGAQAALLLFFNQRLFLGMGFDGHGMVTYQGGLRSFWQEPAPQSKRLHLRIVNNRNIVSFYYSLDGQQWTRHGLRSEVSGYNANTMSDLQSLRPALCGIGQGQVRFRNYQYRRIG